MKVIVEVGAASAMLGEACHARMALAILANASEVRSVACVHQVAARAPLRGHAAAAPPSSVMNSRRFMSYLLASGQGRLY
jgi:hypothetical protein